jgi:hypothetical protein
MKKKDTNRSRTLLLIIILGNKLSELVVEGYNIEHFRYYPGLLKP